MIKHPNNMLQHLENIVLHGSGIAGVCALLMGKKNSEARQKRSKPRRNRKRRSK